MNDRDRAKPAVAIPPATVVEEVRPQVDGGRFPIKRVVGEEGHVTAACYAHGHEVVAAAVRYRRAGEAAWRECPMEATGNDLWSGRFGVDQVGPWEYKVACWLDHLTAWRDGFARRIEPDDIRLNARIGAELVARSSERCQTEHCEKLEPWSRILR